MSEPTPQLVLDFWQFMTSTFASRVVKKENSELMALVADALSLLGVQDKTAFLTRFATTIGRTIYVPFDVGDYHPAFSLWDQMTTCVHEHQHVRQFDVEDVRFAAKYLTSGAQRAAYEAEAYCSNLEIDWWRYRVMRDPAEQAERLTAYGCSKDDVASAAQILTLSQETIRYGGITSDVSKTAIDWLNEHAAHLKTDARNLTAVGPTGSL